MTPGARNITQLTSADLVDTKSRAEDTLHGLHQFEQTEWFLQQLRDLQPIIVGVEEEFQLRRRDNYGQVQSIFSHLQYKFLASQSGHLIISDQQIESFHFKRFPRGAAIGYRCDVVASA